MARSEEQRETDLELVEGIKAGDTERFERLFTRYQFLAIKVSKQFTVIEYDFDDIMQEAKLLFFQVIHEYQSERGMSFGNFYKLKLKQFFYNLIRRWINVNKVDTKRADT